MGEKIHLGEIFEKFCAFLDPVIEMFWIFQFRLISTLSNSLQKAYFQEKSGFESLVWDFLHFLYVYTL